MPIPGWPWFALNALRAVGSTGLVWLLIVQFIQLGHDAQEMTRGASGNDNMYVGSSTVANQPGGGFFMVASRLLWVIWICFTLAGQVGLPEAWLDRHLPWLGPQSGPIYLGASELAMAIESQRHKAERMHLIPAWILLGVSLANIALAIALWMLAKRLPPHPSPVLIFSFTQRLLFFRSAPALYASLLPDVVAAKTDISAEQEADRLWRAQYPTFSGRALGDPEAAIPHNLVEHRQDGTVVQMQQTRTTTTNSDPASRPERHTTQSRQLDETHSGRSRRQRQHDRPDGPISRRNQRIASSRGRQDTVDQILPRPPRGDASLLAQIPNGGKARSHAAEDTTIEEAQKYASLRRPVDRDERRKRETMQGVSKVDAESAVRQAKDSTTRSTNVSSIAVRRGSGVPAQLRLRSGRDEAQKKRDRVTMIPATAPHAPASSADDRITPQRVKSSLVRHTNDGSRYLSNSVPAHRSVRFQGLPSNGGDDDDDAFNDDHKPASTPVQRNQQKPTLYHTDSSAYSGMADSDASVASLSPPLTAIPPQLIARPSSSIIDPALESGDCTPRTATSLRPPPRRRSSTASQSAKARMVIAMKENPQTIHEQALRSAPILGTAYLDGTSACVPPGRRPSSASIASTISGLSEWTYRSSGSLASRRRCSGTSVMSTEEARRFWATARSLASGR